MKKIIGIVIASLVFCNIGFAEMKMIEEKVFEGKGVVSTFCVDGYKFVTFGDGNGISIVQFYELRKETDLVYGGVLPAEC